MNDLSECLEFEKHKIKDKITLLNNYQSKSVVKLSLSNIDVFSVNVEQYAYVNYMKINQGN